MGTVMEEGCSPRVQLWWGRLQSQESSFVPDHFECEFLIIVAGAIYIEALTDIQAAMCTSNTHIDLGRYSCICTHNRIPTHPVCYLEILSKLRVPSVTAEEKPDEKP